VGIERKAEDQSRNEAKLDRRVSNSTLMRDFLVDECASAPIAIATSWTRCRIAIRAIVQWRKFVIHSLRNSISSCPSLPALSSASFWHRYECSSAPTCCTSWTTLPHTGFRTLTYTIARHARCQGNGALGSERFRLTGWNERHERSTRVRISRGFCGG
jgi:hypothetical protein